MEAVNNWISDGTFHGRAVRETFGPKELPQILSQTLLENWEDSCLITEYYPPTDELLAVMATPTLQGRHRLARWDAVSWLREEER